MLMLQVVINPASPMKSVVRSAQFASKSPRIMCMMNTRNMMKQRNPKQFVLENHIDVEEFEGVDKVEDIDKQEDTEERNTHIRMVVILVMITEL